jgi:DNA mismatch repair protein MSH2
VVSCIHERRFGFAVFYPDRRAIRICEYIEDSHASRTEALLLQVQPRSCCAALSEADDVKKVATVAESCGVTLAKITSSDFRLVDPEQDLLRLLCDTEGCGLGRHLEEQRQKQAMRALAALISHGNLLGEPSNFGSCTLGLYPLRNFLYMDKAAFSALNVLPKAEESLRSSTSILGLLNRCRSALGTRRLRQWLTQPLNSADEIGRRHDVVEAFCGAEGLLRQVEAYFRHVPDLERIATRLHRVGTKSTAQKANLEDLVSLYQCVRGSNEIMTALDSYSGVHHAVFAKVVAAPLRACIGDFGNFCALAEQTIDLKQAEQRTYCINSAFDASLQQLATQRDRVRDEMEAVRKTVDADLAINARGNERAVSLTECPEGQALRVTKKHQEMVKKANGKIKYKTLAIKKQEFVFTCPELEKLNARFREAIAAYDKQSAQLVAKAVAVAATYRPVVDRLAESLGTIDVLAAFARAALLAPCQFVRPKIDPEGNTFKIEGATHALVVANSEKSFIANDLTMDKDDSRLHLITGPNMGGKSTYIRSVALIALLNQIGSFVPCQSATLPVFDAIMCRVGASDMQLRGISTFMAEMLEASCILNTATNRTLVVIDELGRGTSTSDGFGIAWAIARYLVEQTRSFTLFATHFHELAALEQAVPAVRNRHATARVDPASGSLTFLYSLADGHADQSYGAHCAELAGFPKRVVQSARERAERFEASSDFGRSAKRQKTDDSSGLEVDVAYVMAADSEDEFVRRALEKASQLKAAAALAKAGC